MSWYVNITGSPTAVNAAVVNDPHTPVAIKKVVDDLTELFPSGEVVTVETQGHFEPSATPPTGQATLVFKVQKFAKETEVSKDSAVPLSAA
jgi:hypothetical protein